MAAAAHGGPVPALGDRRPERPDGPGARAALERLRPEWARLPFLGCDGLPNGGRLDVDEGRLAATVTMPSCASPAVELVGKWIRSGVVPPDGRSSAPSPYPAR